MKQRKKKQKAFTLVELMVVVTILGILASITSIKVIQYLKRARVVKAHTDMKRLMNALDLFYLDNHEYPESLEELSEGTEEHPEGIISGIPKDPWGGDYEYAPDDEHGYELVCYGRDGTEGGEGEDEDIISYEMDQGEAGEGEGEFEE